MKFKQPIKQKKTDNKKIIKSTLIQTIVTSSIFGVIWWYLRGGCCTITTVDCWCYLSCSNVVLLSILVIILFNWYLKKTFFNGTVDDVVVESLVFRRIFVVNKK